MASAAELTQQWLNTGSSSGSTSTPSTSSPTPAPSTPSEEMSSATEESDTEVRAENSTMDDLLSSSEDTPEDSSVNGKAAATAKAPNKQGTSNKEVITVTDDKGNRRKVEINYDDKESIKRAYSMMHGARKWQAERDREIKNRQELQGKLSQKDKDWNVLEAAYQKGPEELFDLLQGRRGAWKEHEQKVIQRAEYLKNATPQQKAALEAQEEAARQRTELERMRKENDDFKKEVTTQRETAELRSLESRVNPIFDKYRFAEKLGNKDDEHLFDEMLWNSALKRLEPYEEKGLEITQELVEREFRSVATAIRKRIGAQASTQAKNVVAQKKQEATENVQSKLKSGYRSSSTAQEARDMINSGNLTGLLKGWSKYGNLFQGKK